MSQGKAKRKGNKKRKPSEVIRTDVWKLKATAKQKHQMMLTIQEYRHFLEPLVLLVNAQWVKLRDLTSMPQVNAVEKMFHQTADNPDPKHKFFQKVVGKHPSFLKFPSYLRPAAIADAIGIVSSFQTRYREWQSGIRKHRQAKPPRLTAMCRTYPALYKGQQILYGEGFLTVSLKVWNGKDWVWIESIPVKSHGLNRHLTEGDSISRFSSQQKSLSTFNARASRKGLQARIRFCL